MNKMTNTNKLLNELNIEGMGHNGSVKCFKLNVKGTRFLSPITCYYSFLMGQGDDKYRTAIGDKRYREIEHYIVKHIIPNMRTTTGGGYMMDSYGLKHLIERTIGGYVSNETVKFIMAYHGALHLAERTTRINVLYPMSKAWVKRHSVMPREMSDIEE